MKKTQNTKRMLLHKGMKICTFFVMTFFSVLLISTINVSAASFKYSEFDWDSFYAENKYYWEPACKKSDGTIDETCEYKILKNQKKFYTKLYKMLAKYEDQGLFIRDDIILQTVFYELTPSQFSDDSSEYNATYNSSGGLYAVDDSDLDDPIIDIDFTNESSLTYFSKETDTLKILLQNMIAYTTSCYGIYGDPTKHVAQDGTTYYTCDNGGKNVKLNIKGLKCVDTIQASNNLGFWEYYVSRLQHDESLNWSDRAVNSLFLGRAYNDKYYDLCKTYTNYAEGTFYDFNEESEVSTDRYFDFLSYNIYFDKKAHLQSKFKQSVLDPAGVDCMTSDLCSNSLESLENGYETYEGEIIEIRRRIINDIISVVNSYNPDDSDNIYYDPVNSNEYNQAVDEQAARKSFYWPIGSSETEVRNGITYADKDPSSTSIVSRYGTRENPITGTVETHYGIDISGIDGETNVISVYRGEVISIISNCTVGDYTCNEGYGNTIIISHSNGDYTVYGHLASIDSNVTIGTSVDKGQIIGKVGSTGSTNTAVLHYEIRKGGNDITSSIDPLNETSPDNPRPTIAAGDFAVHETTLTKEEFVNKLKVYCNSNKCSSEFLTIFVANAEDVYELSIKYNVNPELVVIRGAKEGMSPGGNTRNYWGIGCYNGAGTSACHKYSSLEDGIKGFAKVVASYNTVSEMMTRYAYIGAVWYNPGSWSLGGCKYYPYVSEYMTPERSTYVSGICNNGPSCANKGDAGCTNTTDEDQYAYTMFNIRGMVNMRYVAFGL